MGRWGRKLTDGVLLAGILLLLIGQAPVQAANGLTPVFNDVAVGHWAEQDIAAVKAKGLASGVGEGLFGVNDPVTLEQVVLLLVRALGQEGQGQGLVLPTTMVYGQEISAWAKDAVALAVKEKIIDPSWLAEWRPGQPALRYQIAGLVVRALGLAEDASQQEKSVLAYQDAAAIPLGYRGYVAVAGREGMMTGTTGGNFEPLAVVTRAQIAVVLARVDRQLQRAETGARWLKLELVDIIGSALEGKDPSGQALRVPVTAGTALFRSGQRGELGSLNPGEVVYLVVDKDGRASFGQVRDEADFNRQQINVEGLLSSRVGNTLTIQPSNDLAWAVRLEAGSVVTIDGKPGTVQQLQEGMQVAVAAVGGQVQVTAVNRVWELYGTLENVLYTPQAALVLTSAGGNRWTVTVAETAVIWRQGVKASLRDLVAGDVLVLEILNNAVQRAFATQVENTVEGKVQVVTISTNPTLTLLADDDKEQVLQLASNLEISSPRGRLTLGELQPGDNVRVSLQGERVVKIEVLVRQEYSNFTGQVVGVHQGARVLTVRTGSPAQDRQVFLEAGALLLRGTDSLKLSELKLSTQVLVVGREEGNLFLGTTVLLIGPHN